MVTQKGQAVTTPSLLDVSASSSRSMLILFPIFSSIHIQPPPAPQHRESALFSTEQIVERIERYASANGKKVLYVLSYPAASIRSFVETGERWDRRFVDYLERRGLPFVDLMSAHVSEFRRFNFGIDEYLNRYLIGHYNPPGNHFCAFAIKKLLVETLKPKPFPYREDVIRNALE